mmetsp:Transcript_1241/g.2706  ORF Transcript_1241/g.2706 Transcript_1241/m.2706 type:complete len:130 (+) Transcript_1241:168-557(+)
MRVKASHVNQYIKKSSEFPGIFLDGKRTNPESKRKGGNRKEQIETSSVRVQFLFPRSAAHNQETRRTEAPYHTYFNGEFKSKLRHEDGLAAVIHSIFEKSAILNPFAILGGGNAINGGKQCTNVAIIDR